MMYASVRNYTKPMILAFICVFIYVLNSRYGLSSYITGRESIESLRLLVESNYCMAAFIYFAAASVASVLLALPGVFFAVAAGMMFGPVAGTLLCLAAATVGAVLAFLAGRFFLKDSVKPMVEKNRVLKKFLFDNAEKSAMVMLMVTRLVPIFPYNLQNFAYGITDVKLVPYTLYTFFFMAPGVALFTLGAAGMVSPSGGKTMICASAAGALLLAGSALAVYKKFYKNNQGGTVNE